MEPINAKTLSAVFYQICTERFLDDTAMIPLYSEVFIREVVQGMILQLRSFVLAQDFEEINIEERFPKDWKEAVKERFFPKFLLNYFPVKYNSISIHRKIPKKLCPHATEKWEDNSKVHMLWLNNNEDNL